MQKIKKRLNESNAKNKNILILLLLKRRAIIDTTSKNWNNEQKF